MKLVRDARTLKTKAIESLRTAMTAFNSYDDTGRITTVLMHAQHACEMLLKCQPARDLDPLSACNIDPLV